MPEYEIEQYEIHVSKYRVEANSEAEAIVRVLDGEGEAVDDSQEYVEVCEDRGLPADEHQDLADQLRAMGIPVDEIVPSIRSVIRVE